MYHLTYIFGEDKNVLYYSSLLSDNEAIFFIQSTVSSQHAEQHLALYSVAFELQNFRVQI